MAEQKKRGLVLAVCCGAHGVQDGLGAALYVLTPILAQAFGLSYAQVGMIRAAYSCTGMVFEMPSGVLAERLGERRLLVFGLICAGLGYLLLSAAAGVWSILLSLLILGTGSAFQHALSSSLISNGFDDTGRRSALGLYNSAGDVGKLVFTGLFGLATGVGLAWQGAVVFFAAVAFVCALVVLLVLRRVGAGGRRLGEQHEAATAGAAAWGVDDRPGFLALCVTVSLDTAVQAGFLVFVVFVITDMGVATHLAAFAVVLTLFGGIFGKAGCGYLAERIGVRNAFVLVQLATAAGIIALAASTTPVTAFFVLPFLGMVLQGSTTITYGSIADLFPSNRQSRGFAMIYTVSGLTAIAGPVVFGLISDYAGLGAALLAMALVSLLAIPPSLLLWTGSRQRGTV